MLSLQYKPLWALHHVSQSMCHISEHLQDTLFTKLLSQFIEVHNSQFFQGPEILLLTFPTVF